MPSAEPNPGLNTIRVKGLDDAGLSTLLEPYRNQKDAWLRAERSGGTGLGGGLFMAEGELVVRTLLETSHRVVSVLCTPRRLEEMADAFARLPAETPVLVAEREVLASVVGFDLHRGVLALGERSPPPSVGMLLERARTVVVCENLANHDNVGAVFRNVACLAGGGSGASGPIPAGVLLSPACCDPLYRKSLRVSMGHALRVPFARLEPWPDGLAAVRDAGFELVACTPGEEAEPVNKYDHVPNIRLAVMVGAEGPGLSDEATAWARRRVRVPMAAGADSLNVATALAVVLSWLVRPGTP